MMARKCKLSQQISIYCQFMTWLIDYYKKAIFPGFRIHNCTLIFDASTCTDYWLHLKDLSMHNCTSRYTKNIKVVMSPRLLNLFRILAWMMWEKVSWSTQTYVSFFEGVYFSFIVIALLRAFCCRKIHL